MEKCDERLLHLKDIPKRADGNKHRPEFIKSQHTGEERRRVRGGGGDAIWNEICATFIKLSPFSGSSGSKTGS